MPPITADLLVVAGVCMRPVATRWAPHIASACKAFEIVTPPRLAAFLAQVGHESASLARTVENLNYSADALERVWPARFTSELAKDLARKPVLIANHVYGGRMGNKEPGDGYRFRGRGLLQITGRANYEAVNDLLSRIPGRPDFLRDPDALAEPRWAALSAAALWKEWGLNALADRGAFDDITRRINGGMNGAADRRARYNRARGALIG